MGVVKENQWILSLLIIIFFCIEIHNLRNGILYTLFFVNHIEDYDYLKSFHMLQIWMHWLEVLVKFGTWCQILRSKMIK
jgi:hypothetical protein